MNKNKTIVIMLFMLFLIVNVTVSAIEWTTLDFGGKADTTAAEQEPSWTTLTFGGKADILAQVAPTQNSESPTNQTIGMSLNPTLQITLNDANGDTMNQSFWTNESGTWLAIGWNNNTGNGAVYNITTVFDTYSTKYWWSSNVTDGTFWTNNTYYFTTETETEAGITWTTLTFGGKAEVQDYTWGDWSSWWNFTYADSSSTPTQTNPNPANNSIGNGLTPTLSITVDDDNSLDLLNVTWSSNSSGSWINFGVNNSIDISGGAETIYQTNSNFSEQDTIYYWSLNLTDGTNWCNETYHFTTIAIPDPPTSFTATANGETQIDLTWTKGEGADKTYIEWKPSGSWDRGDGAFLYNDTGVSTSHSGLSGGTTRCYQGWSYNDTYNTWSLTYDGDCATTETPAPPNNPPGIADEYPPDTSISVSLTPICSVYVTDADGDLTTVKFYNSTDGIIYNIQQTNNTVSSGTTVIWRYTQATLYDTKYYWRVTANDGEDTTTESYYFTTYETAGNWPTITNETPPHQSIEQPLTINWTVYITDPNGDAINWTINCSNGQNSSADLDSNGTKNVTLSGLTEYTTYTVYVNVTDGTNWVRKWYIFTTKLLTFYGIFDYKIKGGLVTLTPVIEGATHYRWTFENETGTTGQTPWIPIENINKHIQGYTHPTIIMVTLSIKNTICGLYANYTNTIIITKASFEEPEPTVEEPEPDLKFKNVISDWLEERKPGEFLVIGLVIILVLLILYKKRPQKTYYYTKKKEK